MQQHVIVEFAGPRVHVPHMRDSTMQSLSDRLEQVVQQFASRVRAAAAGHGLREEDLSELVQNVRIRLWHVHERGGNLEALPASYIYNVARSSAVDMLRRRNARGGAQTDSLAAADAQQSLAAEDPADQWLGRREIATELEAALATLAADRAAVVRSWLAGYSREEIASIMRWTEARTRNLLYRGLDDLRRELSRRGVVPETR